MQRHPTSPVAAIWRMCTPKKKKEKKSETTPREEVHCVCSLWSSSLLPPSSSVVVVVVVACRCCCWRLWRDRRRRRPVVKRKKKLEKLTRKKTRQGALVSLLVARRARSIVFSFFSPITFTRASVFFQGLPTFFSCRRCRPFLGATRPPFFFFGPWWLPTFFLASVSLGHRASGPRPLPDFLLSSSCGRPPFKNSHWSSP